LRPFVGESKFGDFKRLWDEMRIKYRTDELVRSIGMNLSFELYGKRNKILLDYNESLEARLLFGIQNGGKIIPPTEIEFPESFDVPKAFLIESFPGGKDFEMQYNRVRDGLNKQLIVVKVEVDGEEKIESLSGMEGAVIYIVKDGAIQFKAKPDVVQDIHWAASKGIPYHSIYTTIINAYEETDEPTFELIHSLLLEEFDESQIERRRITIYKMMDAIKFEKKLKAELREEYLKNNFNIREDKVSCMRHFGKLYDKRLAGKIFRYLMDEFGSV
jgi:hypothetical protein